MFVSDVPGKPGLPTLVDWDVDRVMLKWAPPKSNGGASITTYIIEAKEKFSASWNEMTDTGVSKILGYSQIIFLKIKKVHQTFLKVVVQYLNNSIKACHSIPPVLNCYWLLF